MERRRRKDGITLIIISLLLLSVSSCLSSANTHELYTKEITSWRAYFIPDNAFVQVGSSREPMETSLFIRAALKASGVSPWRLFSYERKVKTIISDISDRAREDTSRPLAETALLLLHEYLQVYDENAHTLVDIVDKGSYNCVSSSILYYCVLRELGIRGEGVGIPDHLFIRVYHEGKVIDVETTNPYGYDPGKTREIRDEHGVVIGNVFVPPIAQALRERLGEKAILGKILSNRVVQLDKAQDYRNALLLGVAFHTVRKDSQGEKFLVDRITNMIAHLNAHKEYEQAYAASRAALEVLGHQSDIILFVQKSGYNVALFHQERRRYDTVLTIVSELKALSLDTQEIGRLGASSLTHAILDYLRQEKIQQARNAYDRYHLLVGEYLTVDLNTHITDAELVHAAKSSSFAHALATLDAAVIAGFSRTDRITEIVQYIYQKEIRRLAETESYLSAALLSDEALMRLPTNIEFRQLAENYRYNYAVTIHNNFVALCNLREYEQAKTLIEEALTHLPDSPILVRNYELIQEILLR